MVREYIDLPFINRSAVILEPKQAFVDWINASDDDETHRMTLDELRDGEATVFLLPAIESTVDMNAWLKRNYLDIFEYELYEWYIDPDLWPKDRSFAVFKTFFRPRFNSMVIDMCDEPVEEEEG